MDVNYSIEILRRQKSMLQDTIFEIKDGRYDGHPVEQINKLKSDIYRRVDDLERGIKYLVSQY